MCGVGGLSIRSVHPRTGGEHSSRISASDGNHGSSPHGRGTLPLRCSDAHELRFIPARAGNTVMQCHVSPAFAVHPRTGGEHQLWLVQENTPPGSSPHGRGTQRDMREPEFKRRFIPARAGNTPRRPFVNLPRAVHPRTGGEHSATCESLNSSVGSSPHGRGTPPGAHS